MLSVVFHLTKNITTNSLNTLRAAFRNAVLVFVIILNLGKVFLSPIRGKLCFYKETIPTPQISKHLFLGGGGK